MGRRKKVAKYRREKLTSESIYGSKIFEAAVRVSTTAQHGNTSVTWQFVFLAIFSFEYPNTLYRRSCSRLVSSAAAWNSPNCNGASGFAEAALSTGRHLDCETLRSDVQLCKFGERPPEYVAELTMPRRQRSVCVVITPPCLEKDNTLVSRGLLTHRQSWLHRATMKARPLSASLVGSDRFLECLSKITCSFNLGQFLAVEIMHFYYY